MNKQSLKITDTIALTENIPEHKLLRGQVGTVVEILGNEVYEVEFSDDNGKAYAILPIKCNQLIKLHFDLSKAA